MQLLGIGWFIEKFIFLFQQNKISIFDLLQTIFRVHRQCACRFSNTWPVCKNRLSNTLTPSFRMPSSIVPAVSVIIPVRNSGRYFRECLDSVTGQTLHNIEVIIIDDASTDGSDVVAESYAALDSRITVIHHKESTGAGPARNDGMAIAKGEYIAFMDSDDLYPTADVLEKLYRTAVEKKANICGGSLYKIDADGNILDMKVPDQYFEKEGWVKYRDYQYDGGFYRFLYRKNFLKGNNIIFPAYKRFQDPVFFVTAMTLSEVFYIINIYTYAYRKNHKSITWDAHNLIGHLKGVIYILKISKKNKLHKLHKLMIKNLINLLHYKTKKYKIKLYIIKYILYAILNIDWNSFKLRQKIYIFSKILYYYM